MQRLLAIAVLVTFAAGVTAAAWQTPALQPGEARARLDAGDVLEVATTAAGPFSAVDDGALLSDGAHVRAVRGEPQLESGTGAVLSLRPTTVVTVGRRMTVERGDVLVESKKTAHIRTAIADISGSGVIRVAQALSTWTRSYAGTATVRSVGRSLAVPALRETTVPAAGLVARRPAPTGWRTNDPWDLRYLADVIAIDQQLEAQGRGFARQAAGVTAADIGPLVGLPADAVAGVAGRRSTGETLVGSAIAAVGSSPVASVFGLRDDGAAWGVVAAERAGRDPRKAVDLVRSAIERWLRRAAEQAAAAAGAAPPAPTAVEAAAAPVTAAAAPVPTTATVGSSSSAPAPEPAPTTTTPVTVPPVTVPPATLPPLETSVPTATTLVPSLTDGAQDLIGGLLAGG